MENWRIIQKNNFHDIHLLADFLELSESNKRQLLERSKFPLNLPRRLAQKIKKNCLEDPILRQFVPLKEETHLSENFVLSPTQDEKFCKTTKLLKKYEGRALLLPTSACAMNCRFCFRQNYPYETENKTYAEELKIIREDRSLFEIILSGGDPLSLSDSKLKDLLDAIEAIDHIKIIRFHTRFPIGIPERISDAFLSLLKNRRVQIIFIVHINHRLELDTEVILALKNLQKSGIPILTHTVLLRGVNDDIETLVDLNLALIKEGFLPYYLNQLDPVQGSAHFEVDKARGLQLHKEMQKRLPGYGVPRYIQEVPGAPSKTLLYQV